MWFIAGVVVGFVIGFVVGLLVGRKNPAVADAAAVGANFAKSEAQNLADKAKQ